MLPEAQFNGIVENAIDFLTRAIEDVERAPKYSLLSFTAAVELVLKARLMREHWSLVIDDPRRAHRETFRIGDFKSVGMEEAIQRLKSIAGVSIPGDFQKALTDLRNHRNRLIHFFHKSYRGVPDDSIESVLTLQFRVWSHLETLVIDEWWKHFSDYESQFVKLQHDFRGMRWYLQARYDRLLPEINALKSKGVTVMKCPVCEYDAACLRSSLSSLLAEHECLVCDHMFRVLTGTCPVCNFKIPVISGKKPFCAACGQTFAVPPFVEAGGLDAKESVYCGECSVTERPTVVNLDESSYLCTHCSALYSHWDVGRCEWCGELATGDLGDRINPGCPACWMHIMREVEDMERRDRLARASTSAPGSDEPY